MEERGVQESNLIQEVIVRILRSHWAFNRIIVINWSIVIKSEYSYQVRNQVL